MVNKLRPQGVQLSKQFPDGVFSKFVFGYNMDSNGKPYKIDIYLKSNYMKITDPRFKANKKWMTCLYGNYNFPRIWRSRVVYNSFKGPKTYTRIPY